MRITAGHFKNHRLHVPKKREVRPTTEKMRQAIFNILQTDVEESLFLDLFAGSGAMGLEALSRGATAATFIEKNDNVARCIRTNIANLQLQKQARLLVTDVILGLKLLAKEGALFSIIYADPPYESAIHNELLKQLDTFPLLVDQGILLIEEASQTEHPPFPLTSLKLIEERPMGSSLITRYESIRP